MPVGLPPMKNVDEFGRPLRRPQPGLDSHARWAWIAAAAFAALALALKLLLWRADIPSAFFVALAALFITAALWGWLMSGRAAVTGWHGLAVVRTRLYSGQKIGRTISTTAVIRMLSGRPTLK
jgi:hypothetical protein